MKQLRLALAAAFAIIGIAQPAYAAKSVATFYGTLTSGYDRTGVFGTADTNLANATAIFAFLFDDAKPGAYVSITPTSSEIKGGTQYGTSSPGSATVTINGVTVPIAGDYYGYAGRHNGDGYDQIDYFAQDSDGTGPGLSNWVHAKVTSEFNDFINSTSFSAPLDYTLTKGTTFLADFQFYNPGVGDTGSVQAYGNMNVSRVTVQSLVPAVPEPATWLMMIAGFAIVGVLIRRRRNEQTAYRHGAVAA